MNEHAMLAIAGILFLGMLCQWLAWRVKLPAILFLLVCGLVVGPGLGWLRPEALFGDLFFPFVSLAVAIILFEGSLTLKFRDIPGLGSVIRNLVTVGVLVTWGITAVAARTIMAFPWELALLFGAIVVVTGPTVIMPMLRTIRPSENIANVLRWEGILIDPLGASLAVLAYQFILSKGLDGNVAHGLFVFGKILFFGVGLGALAGFLFGTVLRRDLMPQYLQNVATLACVCTVFVLSNLLETESGLLTVTVMGLVLANMRITGLEDILAFKESLGLVLISTLFLVLSARVGFESFFSLGWKSLGVFAVIQFLSRPLSVQLSALGSKLSANERHLLAWIAPRGIVSAAIASLFAFRLTGAGYAQAGQMVPLTFLVIMGTILLQGATAGAIARWLGVAEPEPKGLLIIGVNPFTQVLAVELKKNGFRVRLTDQDWSATREAVMMGIETYWGNPVSEHADRHLDLVGLGYLLAITPQVELNLLVTHYYRSQFDHGKIYAIKNAQQGAAEAKYKTRYLGASLFGDAVTYDRLHGLVADGARIKTTLLTSEFSYEDYLRQGDATRLPLFAVDLGDNLHVYTADARFAPKAGWRIIALAWGGQEAVPSREAASEREARRG
jgi:CPA1 family monovalent cation:H+ antiporter